MPIKIRRRTFLRSSAASVGSGVFLTRRGDATEGTSVFRAKVVAHDGRPVANRKIAINVRQGSFKYEKTYSDGVLETEVETDASCSLALYKSDGGQLLGPQLNSVPHIYGLGSYSVESDRLDAGTITLPKGHRVDLRVLDSSGNPIDDAQPGLRHSGYGSGGSLETDSNGYMVITGADFTGVEAAGATKFSALIPGEDDEADKTFSNTFEISEPTTIRAQVGKGIAVLSGGDNSTTSTPPPTVTQSPTQTPTSTQSPTHTAASPSSSDKTTPASTRTSRNRTTGTPSTPAKRGFLHNGENADEVAFLTDPLFMTVSGFALSVAGVVHQLFRGG